ncbi:MAG: 50S ribosomal protein L21 [Chloroflexi bacterium]|nr:50S ribosomal protein L21 [Chloroflexota bacterium]
MDYAVFKTGGKQYRVKPGDLLDVEKLPLEVDSVAEFSEVLVVSDGGEATVGSPYVEGAKVLAQVQSHYRDKKIIVFKYKAKNRYRRMRGHRQEYTRLVIQDIQVGESAPQPARRRTTEAAQADSPEQQGGTG